MLTFAMTPAPPQLSQLEFLPYLEDGLIPAALHGKIGLYAIFAADKTLQLVDYSRDIALSLRQHLVRQPQHCYWLKAHIIERPSRAVLQDLQAAWLAENGATPPGNGEQQAAWHEPIDVKPLLTDAEQAAYATSDELGQSKLLKQVARRIEAERVELLRSAT
ncbi:MAG: GIY-YIG nuclease family protein, partial [Spirulinaceae cyanobacterium RM2_2_10]|nr:GIY-YIG nuclease family protein [Spirulinaceae cyanobacterium RM2_2_10]